MSRPQQFDASDVSVAIMNFEGAERLPPLIESLRRLENPPGEILIVDDGSTDGGAEKAVADNPDIRLVSMGSNTGILNKVRNTAFRESSRRLVFLVDNDVTIERNCLEELLKIFNSDPQAAAVITRAVYMDNPEIIYQDGQILHYVGAAPDTHRGKHISEISSEPRLSEGWGVQLIDSEAAEIVDYFNEGYLLGWGDDGEINHKLMLRGYRCYQVPAAIVLHGRQESSKRYLAGVQNRLRYIAEMYHWKTILLSLPAFLVYEIALIGFLISKRSIRTYFRGWRNFLSSSPHILRVRKKIQASRQVPDREVMGAGNIFVYSDYVSSRTLMLGFRSMNWFLQRYWNLIQRWV